MFQYRQEPATQDKTGFVYYNKERGEDVDVRDLADRIRFTIEHSDNKGHTKQGFGAEADGNDLILSYPFGQNPAAIIRLYDLHYALRHLPADEAYRRIAG